MSSINYDKLDNVPQIVINNNVAPAGVAPVQEEDVESRREAHKWAHRLNISSKIHIGAGVVAAIGMAHAALNARHIAQRMLHQGGRHPHPHPHPHHGEEEVDGRHPHPHPHPHHGEEEVDGRHPHPHPHPFQHRFVSQAEFGVYDIFGIIAFIGLMASMVLVAAGRHSLRASHWHKSRFTHRVFHGHILRVLAMSLMGYYAKHRAEEMTRIIWRSHHHPHPHPWFNSTETARNLEQDETIELFQTEEPTVAEPTAEMYEEPTEQSEQSEGHGWNRHHHHHRQSGQAFALVFGLATAAHLHILKKLERAQKHREETSNVSA